VSSAVGRVKASKQIRDIVPDVGVRGRRMPDLIAAPALPLADIALFLDLPLSTVDKLRAEGRGPKCFKLGRRLYVRQVDLRAWLDVMAREAAA
jgi:Helix-turn-helix domain